MIELRAEGRRLIGTVIRYGEVGDPGFPEAFQRGAFKEGVADVLLNLQHDRRAMLARTPTTLLLMDGAEELRMIATLPQTRLADDVLALVNARVLRGLSVGFHAIRERLEGDRRIIERAMLDHIAVCDRPAYAGSRVDARNAPLRIWGVHGYRDGSESGSTGSYERPKVKRWL